MIQYNTQNESFIKIHIILKQMGLENNAFFLQLYDQDLLDVDPHDEEKLTQQQKMKILIEIKRNPWYFFREIVRIPTGSNKLMFELNRGTLAILWGIVLDLEFVHELPRQSYKTFTTAAAYCWLFYWGAENAEGALFGHSLSLVTQNLERIKDIRNALPSYLNLKRDKFDSDNKSFITYKQPTFTNRLIAQAPGMNEIAADKVGRGRSTVFQWYDEMTFTPYIDIQYGAAIYAYTTVARQAEKSGERHHIIATTTAGNKTKGTGKWTYEFFKKAAPFTELLYDKFHYDENGVPVFNRESIKEYVRNNALNKTFLYAKFMWYELSKPENYLDDMMSKSDSIDQFNREVLLQWTTADGNHPLGKERVEKLRETVKKPYKMLILDEIYFLKLYRDPDILRDQSAQIVFGMDCGGNLQQDYSTFVGLDVTNNEVVAVMRINQHSATRFANTVAYILSHLFPRSILVGERNYVGIVILEIIAKIIGQHRVYTDESGKLGVHLIQSMRNLMYNDVLRTSVINHGEKIHDEYIIDEIAGLIKNPRNGRIDHASNGNDDTLIAYLYTRWFAMYCKTKEKYIDPILFGFEKKNEMGEYELEEYIDERTGKSSSELRSVYKMNKESFDKAISDQKHLIDRNGLDGGVDFVALYDDFKFGDGNLNLRNVDVMASDNVDLHYENKENENESLYEEEDIISKVKETNTNRSNMNDGSFYFSEANSNKVEEKQPDRQNEKSELKGNSLFSFDFRA